MARPKQQKYAKGDIFLGTTHLAEVISVSVKHMSGNQKVNTMAKGRAGVSPGVLESTVSFESAIPVVGREYDYLKALQSGEQVEVVLFRAGKKISASGFFDEVDEKYDVNSSSADSVTISCGPFEESLF